MTDLKRSIKGVDLHVATDDPEKVAAVKQVLDAAMKLLEREKRMNPNWRAIFQMAGTS